MNSTPVIHRALGTAKTTTAAALAVVLARTGIRIHLIDMDPQAGLTRAFGLDDETDRAGLPAKPCLRI